MKKQPIKHPKMTDSSLKVKLMKDESDEIKMAEGGGIMDRMKSEYAGLKEAVKTGGTQYSVTKQANIDQANPQPKSEHKIKEKPDSAWGFAEGGMVDSELEDEHHASIAAAIMAKRQKMADGGQVDIEDNAQEMANDLDDLNEAALKENYDEDLMDIAQPLDSNEHADSREAREENEADQDIISKIRSKMSAKRMFR